MATTARFPNMDALRGIAAMAVILHHIVLEFALPSSDVGALVAQILSFGGHGGSLGVLFFFLLSGYLITYRMLAERTRTGRFHLRRFYMRRALRIWPLYYATLIVGFLVLPAIMGALGRPFAEASSPVLYTLFLANYDMLLNHPPTFGMLGVHWSVCVEEQFYLVWPLLFLLLRTRWAFATGVAASTLASEVYVQLATPHEVYFLLFGNLRYLGLGALLALLVLERGEQLRALLARVPPAQRTSMLIGGACALYYMHVWAIDYPTRLSVATTCSVLFFCYVLVEGSHTDGRSLQVGRIPFATWLGERSYGIYLLHMLALEFARGIFHNDPNLFALEAVTTIILTILLAHLSHRFVESPFMRLKAQVA